MGIPFAMTCGVTNVAKESVAVLGNYKHQFTELPGITADGSFVGFQVIWTGKTDQYHSNVPHDSQLQHAHSLSHLSTEDTMYFISVMSTKSAIDHFKTVIFNKFLVII